MREAEPPARAGDAQPTAASGPVQFCFVQLEVPWALGPADGRYVLRPHAGEDPDHVLVLRTLGAGQRHLTARRRRRLRRRPRRAAPDPAPAGVTTNRVTLIDARALPDAERGAAWLDAADRDALAREALRALNRVLHLHRVAAADPATRDVAREQALVVRVGYGSGEEVAEGRFARAVELPAPEPERTRRAALLRPQERLAALLSGRDVALACEELALRARADVDAGRRREGALTVRPTLDAVLAELEPWADRRDLRERLEELARLRSDAVRVADRALERGLDDGEAADVERVLERIEAALRARTASEQGT